MIFVTFGNAPHGFLRLAIEVDQITPSLGEEVFVQCGHTDYTFQSAVSERFLNSIRMQDYIDRASVVISHGGWGTLSECIAMRKRLVAVPRIQGVEHNHPQDELVRALDELKCLIGVYEISDLRNAIGLARLFSPQKLIRGNGGIVINEFIQRSFPEDI